MLNRHVNKGDSSDEQPDGGEGLNIPHGVVHLRLPPLRLLKDKPIPCAIAMGQVVAHRRQLVALWSFTRVEAANDPAVAERPCSRSRVYGRAALWTWPTGEVVLWRLLVHRCPFYC